MDGIPALDLWDLVIEVLHTSSNQAKKSKENAQGTCCMTHHQEDIATNAERACDFQTKFEN